MTTDDLIAFWSRLGGGTVHPEDDRYLLQSSGFETRLVPLPWNGPIKTTNVFVALLNPGLDPSDIPYEAENRLFCDRLRKNLEGNSPYVYFEPAYADHPGKAWAYETFGHGWPSDFADRLCVLQLVAYHSPGADAPGRVAHKLRSTGLMKAWVQRTLLPRVRRGEALLVVGRGVSKFGVQDEPESEIFKRYRFPEYRRAHMTARTRGGEAIRRFLGV